MVKKRVYEFAKELKLGSKQLMKVLTDLNIEIKSHMSTLSDEEIERVTNHLKQLEQPESQKDTKDSKPKDKKNLIKENKNKTKKKSNKDKNYKNKDNNKTASSFQKAQKTQKAQISEIEIGEKIVVKELAELMGIEVTALK